MSQTQTEQDLFVDEFDALPYRDPEPCKHHHIESWHLTCASCNAFHRWEMEQIVLAEEQATAEQAAREAAIAAHPSSTRRRAEAMAAHPSGNARAALRRAA